MRYLAADFGAGSGRVIIGHIENGSLQLEDIHRFANKQYTSGNTLRWDFTYLFKELKKGIKKATQKYSDIVALGVDTWGVDFGLIGRDGKLLADPVCYRDKRTAGILHEAFKRIDKADLYARTGTQIMEINTAFQLLSMKLNNDAHLNEAAHLLFMPDLVNYFLTGIKKNEYTIASTSSLLNAQTKSWDHEVFSALGLPAAMMCEMVFPGEKIGRLSDALCKELDCYPIDVYAVGSHDTASAAAVTYSAGSRTAYLSSGTWSLMGVHLDAPVLTRSAMESELTNEGGIADKILLLKNITGMWMLQCAIDEWKRAGAEAGITALLQQAAAATPFTAFIDPDDKMFLIPESMCGAIQQYCNDTHQPVPQSQGGYIRMILESLALKYRDTLHLLKQCSGKDIAALHIVGGGAQNKLLNQFTADATGLAVVAGPVEATAIGNILVQAMAAKEISDSNTASKIVGRSFKVQKYHPRNKHLWDNKNIPGTTNPEQ